MARVVMPHLTYLCCVHSFFAGAPRASSSVGCGGVPAERAALPPRADWPRRRRGDVRGGRDEQREFAGCRRLGPGSFQSETQQKPTAVARLLLLFLFR